MRDEYVGFQVGGVGTPDKGVDPVFEIRDDDLVGDRRRLCLQDGLDLTHDGEDMKPGAKGAREFDRREQRFAAGGFVIKVNSEQDVLVHVNLAQTVVRPVSKISISGAAVYWLLSPGFSRHNHRYRSSSCRDLRDHRIPCAERYD